MTNETVGDAISDLFLVETVLCARGQDAPQWLSAYTDLPCRQLKVTVKVFYFFHLCLTDNNNIMKKYIMNIVNKMLKTYDNVYLTAWIRIKFC